MDLGSLEIRKTDIQGSGYFGARRDGGRRVHNGIDLVVSPDTFIQSPIKATVTKLGKPYYDENDSRGRNHFRYVQITDDNGYNWRIYYILPSVALGDVVEFGTVIGKSQKLGDVYKNITEHVHFEIKNQNGEYIDPTPIHKLMSTMITFLGE